MSDDKKHTMQFTYDEIHTMHYLLKQGSYQEVQLLGCYECNRPFNNIKCNNELLQERRNCHVCVDHIKKDMLIKKLDKKENFIINKYH